MNSNLSSFILKLINLSWMGGILAILIMLVRLLFRMAPKRAVCLLWGIVALRLVCPFTIESPVSLLVSDELLSAGGKQEMTLTPNTKFPLLDETVNELSSEYSLAESTENASQTTRVPEQSPFIRRIRIVFIGWGLGAAGMFGYAAVSFAKQKRKVRTAISENGKVWFCDAIGNPFILGIVRPRIYLPSATNEELLNYILAHERTHLKRYDHLWKPIAFLLLSIYWFNPILWLTYVLFCRDIEYACDEKAVETMEEESRVRYSRVLLEAAASRHASFVHPLGFAEACIKERIRRVLYWKKPNVGMKLAVAVIGVALLFAFMTKRSDRSLPESNKAFWQNAENPDGKYTEFLDAAYTLYNGEKLQIILPEDPHNLMSGGFSGFVFYSPKEDHPAESVMETMLSFVGVVLYSSDEAIIDSAEISDNAVGKQSNMDLGEKIWLFDSQPPYLLAKRENVFLLARADAAYSYGVESSSRGNSFTSMISESFGFKLVCSDPASGIMLKSLRYTKDGGETWEETANLTALIGNHPTDMCFWSESDGIILTDHQLERNYVYLTKDGGKTWSGSYLGKESDKCAKGACVEYDAETDSLKVFSYAVSADGLDAQERTYCSNDHGYTWTERNSHVFQND